VEKPEKPFYIKPFFGVFYILIVIMLTSWLVSKVFPFESGLTEFFCYLLANFFTLRIATLIFEGLSKKYNSDLREFEKYLVTKENEKICGKEIIERAAINNEIIKQNHEAIIDLNKNFKVATISEFGETLLKKQVNIGKEHIQDLVKLNEYLVTKRRSIEKQLSLIANLKLDNINVKTSFVDDSSEGNMIRIKPKIELVYKQNKYLENLHDISVRMVNFLLDGNLVMFYSIFNQFEKLGIFNKEWENQLVQTMKNVDRNLIKVIDEIGFMESSISSSIYDLQLEVSLRN